MQSQVCCKFVAISVFKSLKPLILLDYSMIVATRSEPTVRPPSRGWANVFYHFSYYFRSSLLLKPMFLHFIFFVLKLFVIKLLSTIYFVRLPLYHQHCFLDFIDKLEVVSLHNITSKRNAYPYQILFISSPKLSTSAFFKACLNIVIKSFPSLVTK